MSKLKVFVDAFYGSRTSYISSSIGRIDTEEIHDNIYDGAGSKILFYTLPWGCRTIISGVSPFKIETRVAPFNATFLMALICFMVVVVCLENFFLFFADKGQVDSDGVFISLIFLPLLFILSMGSRFLIYLQHMHYLKHLKMMLQ